MAYQPEIPFQSENPFILSERQMDELLEFNLDLDQISGSENEIGHIDEEIARRLNTQQSHITAEMSEAVNGSLTMAVGMASGHINGPHARLDTLGLLVDRGVFGVGSEKTIAAIFQAYDGTTRTGHAKAKNEELKQKTESLDDAVVQRIYHGDEQAKGEHLLLWSFIFGLTQSPDLRFDIEKRIKEEYIR